MFEITVPATELYDEAENLFIPVKETKLRLEHSLVSVSKWEAKWNIPFLSKASHNIEQTLDYIRCMTLNQNTDSNVYKAINNNVYNKILEYINAPMTATTFNELGQARKSSGQVVTSELIYYWMIAYQIPMECQKWHLNRLLTLIRICDIKNTPAKKMSKTAVRNQYSSLNAARRKALNSKG